MSKQQTVVIDYFTDVLCIWAYAAQKRIDEIKKQYAGQVEFRYHFLSIFGAVDHKMAQNWGEKGAKAYGAHVLKVAKPFEHIKVHPDVWQGEIPKSSLGIHIFVKAVQLLLESGSITELQFEQFLWKSRLAFFQDAENIGRREILYGIADELTFNLKEIQVNIDSGAAHAAFEEDRELVQQYQIDMSPTYILNEGRQKLFGNVGYRIIEANLQGLLIEPEENGASWC